jgi:hypothetical protein
MMALLIVNRTVTERAFYEVPEELAYDHEEVIEDYLQSMEVEPHRVDVMSETIDSMEVEV